MYKDSRVRWNNLHKTALTLDTSHLFGDAQDHPHFRSADYKFGVPTTTFRFEKSLEWFTDLNAILMIFFIAKDIKIKSRQRRIRAE